MEGRGSKFKVRVRSLVKKAENINVAILLSSTLDQDKKRNNECFIIVYVYGYILKKKKELRENRYFNVLVIFQLSVTFMLRAMFAGSSVNFELMIHSSISDFPRDVLGFLLIPYASNKSEEMQ